MRTLLVGILMIVGMLQAQAGELHLVVNGKAYHFSNRNYNEKNYGVGFEYDFKRKSNWIHFFNGSTFKDSLMNQSNYIGYGMKRRYKLENDPEGWHADFGFVVFLMTRKDMYDDHPFPGILPVASVGKQWFAINATYIPSVSPKHVSLLFFQIMFRVAEF